MDHVQWSSRPSLHSPVMICAFEGWNDAGDASTTAVRFLRTIWSAEPFAEIDPEEFFDFSSTRPRVELDDGLQRRVVWPKTELSAVRVPGTDTDVVLLLGTEPQLRWRAFCSQVTELANQLGARLVLTVGALLADVPHSRPVSVIGTAADPRLVDDLELRPSTYEGPTGIVGVLNSAAHECGLSAASLWAAVPTYVPAAPSPKAALALVEHIASLLRVGVATTELEIASAAYERQIDELVAADDDTTEYVRHLETENDEHQPDPDSLVEEVERFLRDRGDDR